MTENLQRKRSADAELWHQLPLLPEISPHQHLCLFFLFAVKPLAVPPLVALFLRARRGECMRATSGIVAFLLRYIVGGAAAQQAPQFGLEPEVVNFKLEVVASDDDSHSLLSLVQLRARRHEQQEHQVPPDVPAAIPNPLPTAALERPTSPSVDAAENVTDKAAEDARRQAAAEESLRAAELANDEANDALAAAHLNLTQAQISEQLAAQAWVELTDEELAEKRAARAIKHDLDKAESAMVVMKVENRLKAAVMEQRAQKLKAKIVDAEAEEKLEVLDDRALEAKKENIKNVIVSAGSMDVEEAAVEDQLDKAVTEDQVDEQEEEQARSRTAKLKSELATVNSEASAQRMQDRLTEAAEERETNDLREMLRRVRTETNIKALKDTQRKAEEMVGSELLQREVGTNFSGSNDASYAGDLDPLERAAEEAERAADEAEAMLAEAKRSLEEERRDQKARSG